MEHVAVHRIVEHHAATRGDTPAIVCGADVATYRALNFRANAVARFLIDTGFRRGGHALIETAPGIELAAVLIAVLKAGGAYTWMDRQSPTTGQASLVATYGDSCSNRRTIDLGSILAQPFRPGPNLPILTRPTDPACVLVEGGARAIVVPHATIAALRRPSGAPQLHTWQGDSTTFDLWAGLLTGATLSVQKAPALLNAA